jgi:hypothetical protein
MLWIIEMQNGGVFEASTKRKVINQMIEHYAERGSAGQIKAIYYVFKDDRTDELCQKARNKVQEIVDNGVARLCGQIEENDGAQEILSQDYYSNLV